MSAILRFGLLRCAKNRPFGQGLARTSALTRCISTSKKNSETASTTVAEVGACTTAAKKNWISYGFSEENETEDRAIMHTTAFLVITLIFVFGGFVLAYRPDYLGRDWSQREGYLELRRREKLGLPLIDPNFIPVDKIVLPSDEELGDTEIIV